MKNFEQENLLTNLYGGIKKVLAYNTELGRREEDKLRGNKFSYALDQNETIIQNYFRERYRKFPEVEGYNDYRNEYHKLKANCVKILTNEENKVEGQVEVTLKTEPELDQELFDKELLVLDEKYKDVISKQDAIDVVYKEFLKNF